MSGKVILEKEYRDWIGKLSNRYWTAQIKAAIAVNSEMLRFYWELGRDIISMQSENKYGSKFFETLSRDLKAAIPEAKGFSVRNLKYIKNFYLMYPSIWQQLVAKFDSKKGQQLVAELCKIPWGHHTLLIDRLISKPEVALFYIKGSIEHGWSRAVLDHMLDTSLHITKFLLELGEGFAFVGQEYKLDVGQTEQFTDLLFYNLKLRCYVVIELKVVKFEPGFMGQLGMYVTAVNHLLKTEQDNPTIGLLICKTKDDVLAQYSLEGYNLPIGVSQYQLDKLLPDNFKSSLPSIEEIESELRNN